MNIMTVRAQAGQETGGKIMDTANHGEAAMFAELFTQETTSQQAAAQPVEPAAVEAGQQACEEQATATAQTDPAAHPEEAADPGNTAAASRWQGGSTLPLTDSTGSDLLASRQITTSQATAGQITADKATSEKGESDATADGASRHRLSEGAGKQAPPTLLEERNTASAPGSPQRQTRTANHDGQGRLAAGAQTTQLAQATMGTTQQAASQIVTQAVNPTVNSAVNQAANPGASPHQAAQMLAEPVHVTMSDGANDAEPAPGKTPVDVNTGSGSTAMRAPDWLAQIEHGRRWAQSPASGAGEPTQPGAEGEPLSPEKSAAENKDARRLSVAQQEAASTTTATQAVSQSASQLAAAVTAETVTTDTATGSQTATPEAGVVMAARESAPLMATPERAPLLDRALTLHGSPEQNAKQLAQQAQVVVNQNLQEADIRLNPSELGGLKIQIKMERGEVQVQFVASNPQARELIEQAMPRLREMLNQQGMNLGQGQGQGQQGQQQGQQQEQSLLSGQQQNPNQAASQEQQPRQQGGEVASESEQGYSVTQGGTVTLADGALARPARLDAGRIDFFA
ncbi:flagellar hook-length control protein FliK [Oceanisphaera sp.]|uniref:flagellar hook-length control protein FliK n=1 Tax=Oceanisphaera sp. TaxID=1929979 RepID=UPI003A92B378